MKLKSVLYLAFFFLPCITGNAASIIYFETINEMLNHYYQKQDWLVDKEYPWYYGNSDSDIKNYSLCHDEILNQHPLQRIIVIFPNMLQARNINEYPPADIYIVEINKSKYTVISSEDNIGRHFSSLFKIGRNKMAVHLTMGSLLQGHLQVHDELRVLNNDFFKTIAEWTSLLDNTGALDSSDYKELEESIENKLNVDDSNQELEFYPLLFKLRELMGERD